MRKINNIRRNRYSEVGFLADEVQYLKSIPLNAPYSIMLCKERQKLLNKAFKEERSGLKYKQAIFQLYEVRGWRAKGEPLTKSVVFRMVKDYERAWHDTAPKDEIEAWGIRYAHKSHHGTFVNHQRILEQKRIYNARPDVQKKRAEYRRTHRNQKRQGK